VGRVQLSGSVLTHDDMPSTGVAFTMAASSTIVTSRAVTKPGMAPSLDELGPAGPLILFATKVNRTLICSSTPRGAPAALA
jgi:hypothetical protein